MSVTVDAIFEGGVLKPLVQLSLAEHQQVRVTIVSNGPEALLSAGDPLAGVRAATGIADLAERFDEYRFREKSK